MSDIDKKILDAEKISLRSRPEEPKRKWLKAKCTECGYRFEYEPTELFKGELKCPHCGEIFKVSRLDDFVQ